MLKLVMTVLAVALAGTASADGWRSMRVDAGSAEAFTESLAEFQEALPAARRAVFKQALYDIWAEGEQTAAAEQRDYTANDFYRQLDGLGYEEVVTLTDPSGDTARTRYRAAVREAARYRRSVARAALVPQKSPWPEPPPRTGFNGQQVRGGDPYRYPMQ